MINDLTARVILAKHASPGDEKVGALVAQFGAPIATEKLIQDPKNSALTSRIRQANFDQDFEQIMQATQESQSIILTPENICWPKKLNDLDFASPYCLWVSGDVTKLIALENSCSVVGARAATSYGERVATEIGSTLGEWGITTVSGGAFGIDAATHRGSIAADGQTIAVLASGIDVPYPGAHAGLFKKISEVGLVLTEAPPGSLPFKQKFLTRNRLIAALSSDVVVVEAALRSGSLSTANWANALGRRVWGVPGPITSATSAGVHAGIRNGSMQIMLEVADLIK